MSEYGKISLDRSILNHSVFNIKPFSKGQAWVYILLVANYKDNEIILGSKTKLIKRGQHHTSVKKLAEKWGWSDKKVRNFLGLLEREKMLTTERTPKGTTLTVVNYDKYQSQGKAGRKRKGKLKDKAKDRANDKTKDRQKASNVRTNNKENNDNNKKKDKRKKYGVYNWVRLTDKEYKTLVSDYGEDKTREFIKRIDEQAELTGNKNGWKSWSLVLRKAVKGNWYEGMKEKEREINLQQGREIIKPKSAKSDKELKRILENIKEVTDK